MYTASTAFLDALTEAGVSCIFANFGSDHPSIVEAIARARATGRPIPRVITCPNEMVALSAAQGYAQVTGQAQAVLVHVECGTQALAGAVHNAAKGRAPVLIFAGMSPFTQAGELPGSRNEFIQWIQDVPDQRGIVRGYVKYENDFRTGRNVKQVVHRAMQIAHSDPKGPVYLVGPREVMEEATIEVATDPAHWRPLRPGALAPADVDRLVDALLQARRPLVVTSYLGRNPAAVHELVALCRTVGMGVLESVPNAMNFPTDDPLYQGNQWNQPHQNQALADADLVLVLDSDVPWIPTVSRPGEGVAIYHIDVDPLKERMTLWYIGALASLRADAATALGQLNAALATRSIDGAKTAAAQAHWAGLHRARAVALSALERAETDTITPEHLVASVRRHLDDDSIVLSESISNYHTVVNHLRMTRPGSLITSGGGSLGWHGGAAIGVKLAHPDKTVVAFAGDGSFLFSVPSSVHWMARRYDTPFLTIIFNNRGWKSPKLSALAVHPNGFASRADDIDVSFDPPPDHAGIATASGGAFGRTVRNPVDLESALVDAFRAVRDEKRCAVLDVWVPRL